MGSPRFCGTYRRILLCVCLNSHDVLNRFTVQKKLLDNEVDLAVMGLIEDNYDLGVAPFVPIELAGEGVTRDVDAEAMPHALLDVPRTPCANGGL
jgi:hypothetical protein